MSSFDNEDEKKYTALDEVMSEFIDIIGHTLNTNPPFTVHDIHRAVLVSFADGAYLNKSEAKLKRITEKHLDAFKELHPDMYARYSNLWNQSLEPDGIYIEPEEEKLDVGRTNRAVKKSKMKNVLKLIDFFEGYEQRNTSTKRKSGDRGLNKRSKKVLDQ
jgi:hypothetical protein